MVNAFGNFHFRVSWMDEYIEFEKWIVSFAYICLISMFHCFFFLSNFRARGMAAGISAAINYIMAFVATKTYYNLEMLLSMPGITLFYCVIASMGLILMYNILPETENRSFEDIELHFSDESKKITDWYIPRKHNEFRRTNQSKRISNWNRRSFISKCRVIEWDEWNVWILIDLQSKRLKLSDRQKSIVAKTTD